MKYSYALISLVYIVKLKSWIQKEEDEDTLVYVDHLMEINLVNLFLNYQVDILFFVDVFATIFFINNK